MSRKTPFQIGWYVLTEPKEFRNTYEYAAWYQNVLVPAGRYPVTGYYGFNERDRRVTDQIDDLSISCKLVGKITGSDFSSGFGGVQYGSKRDINLGQESSVYFNPYAHSVAKDICEGKSPFVLLPQFEARPVHFNYQGRPHTTYGIFYRG